MFRADTRDAHIDGAVLTVITNTAQGGEDFLARKDAPTVEGQQPEQIELGTGQLDARAR